MRDEYEVGGQVVVISCIRVDIDDLTLWRGYAQRPLSEVEYRGNGRLRRARVRRFSAYELDVQEYILKFILSEDMHTLYTMDTDGNLRTWRVEYLYGIR